MLRLVHPAPGGQGTDPPKRRRGSRSPVLSLTHDEAQRVRAALRNLARAYGSWGCLAQVMGVPEKSAQQVLCRRRRPSVAMVLLAARAAGTTVEQILSGKIAPAGRCPTCGRSQQAGQAGGAR